MTRREREARRKAAEERTRARREGRRLIASMGWNGATQAALAALAAPRDFTEHLPDDILRDGWRHPDARVRARAAALRKVARYCGTPDQTCRFKAMLHVIQARAPKIAGASFWGPCYTLAGLEWLRPLDAWEPAGKCEETVFRSLVNHLLARYPVPEFLYGVFDLDRATDGYAWVLAELFESFARGESAFEYVMVNIPAVMTRRMCHLFMQSPPGTGIYAAIRKAQIDALGGTPA
ncbi:MAG TPA: hypothetical protein VMU02_10040, partial [bacterium]|nr:hypothetical protein [bacterium]